MLPFWRRENNLGPGPSRSSDSEVPSESSSSYSRHKIHPDINSLAKELESSQAETDRLSVNKGSLEIDVAGFVGLQPSTRSRYLHKEAHRRHIAGSISDQDSCKEAADGYAEPIASSTVQDKKESSEDQAIVAPGHSQQTSTATMQGVSLEEKHRKPSTIMRWATFGRRPDPILRSASRSTSQSSLSQSQSFVTCLPYPSSSDIYPRTPNSQSGSGHISSPNSHSTPNRNFNQQEHDIPSPHTFGMPTPPRPMARESSSYFTYKEVPPPLPPLDHPAFRDVTNTGLASSNVHSFPVLPGKDEQRVVPDKIRTHTYSLPSIPRKISLKTDNAASNRTRPRSKSSAVGESTSFKKESNIISSDWSLNKLRSHSRNYSKGSIASSRRSSAEYSAKQVSSIGHEATQEGGWEVQVSKEMIRLSLGEGEGVRRVETSGRNARTRHRRLGQAVPSATFGKARGENQSAEGASGLGSPFLLQDTLPNNLTDKQGLNEFGQRARLDSGDRVRSATRDNYLRHDMSQGDSRIPSTSFSAKNNTRRVRDSTGHGSPSPVGSRSRRGGGRALSNPSPTRTPSPQPPRLDTVPQLPSIQGSSLLAPPTLSVTSATPEASPISPGRRTHHKSTPTLPSTPVLPPGTPPVIEKSRSSGSGKRKADEAGVGGDKTPPKEQKEPRATFAPEPRTHRASATSANSSHAPSSFNRSKRVRLTDLAEGRPNSRSGSRAGGSLPTPDDSPPNAKTTGSWSSRGSRAPMSASSHTYGPPVAASASYASASTSHPHPPRAPSRRSLSQASIPISALISPHAPSISRTGTFHMRDPRKPSPIQSTPWTLSLPSRVQDDESRWSSAGWVERGGSPLHAWLFFIGFILFPLWWAAALLIPIPETRRLGGSEAEKAVMLDDPQVEHDAKSWRTRCRFMAIVSLFTYIPFIALVAVFA